MPDLYFRDANKNEVRVQLAVGRSWAARSLKKGMMSIDVHCLRYAFILFALHLKRQEKNRRLSSGFF